MRIVTGKTVKANLIVVCYDFFPLDGTALKMEEILNNNAVITLDENGRETVITGRGIAFKKKVGEERDNEQLEIHMPQMLLPGGLSTSQKLSLAKDLTTASM